MPMSPQSRLGLGLGCQCSQPSLPRTRVLSSGQLEWEDAASPFVRADLIEHPCSVVWSQTTTRDEGPGDPISKMGSAHKCKICNIQTSAYFAYKLHISAYFHCLFFAYSRLIKSIILCIFAYLFPNSRGNKAAANLRPIAYLLHIFVIYLHIF